MMSVKAKVIINHDNEIDLYLDSDVDSDIDRKNIITRKGKLI